MFQVRHTPISRGAVTEVQVRSRCNWGRGGSVCRDSWVFLGSHQPQPAERPQEWPGQLGLQWDPRPAADVTMSSASWAFTWHMEGLVTPGWCQETHWNSLDIFSAEGSERWAPSECNYRDNSQVLLLWLNLKSSLSVSIAYLRSPAICICSKDLC